MEPTIENHNNLFSTPLFWDCECSDRYIHPRAETVCQNCGSAAQHQPDSRVDTVLFNAKFWNLDQDLVHQIWAALKKGHPLLLRAFELGFDPEEELIVVTFGDVILRLESLLQDPGSIPAEDLAQLILKSSKQVCVDWRECDRNTGKSWKAFKTRFLHRFVKAWN